MVGFVYTIRYLEISKVMQIIKLWNFYFRFVIYKGSWQLSWPSIWKYRLFCLSIHQNYSTTPDVICIVVWICSVKFKLKTISNNCHIWLWKDSFKIRTMHWILCNYTVYTVSVYRHMWCLSTTFNCCDKNFFLYILYVQSLSQQLSNASIRWLKKQPAQMDIVRLR